MDSSRNRLTPLQRDLVTAFFDREQRLFLTGGGALVGFYFGHRTTEDLDLFGMPDLTLEGPQEALKDAARSLGATIETKSNYQDFRRFIVRRQQETCIVDLVIDRAPAIDREKNKFEAVKVDTPREIAANKICTLISRSEIKDLIDLRVLVESGIDLHQAFADAAQKDRGADPATLAWILDQIFIGPRAALPGGIDPVSLDAWRKDLVKKLRGEAFARVPK